MSLPNNKWDRIYQNREGSPSPTFVLTENVHLLPKSGKALDLACGRGGNALFLAKLGFEVDAWDSSQVAIEQVQAFSHQDNFKINACVRDVAIQPPEPESFDVICVSLFLDRQLCPSLVKALKPGGVLFYQTYCQQKVVQNGPNNPDYLLLDNELLHLFSEMKVRVYREEALLGDHSKGLRNQALLVAEKL